MIRVRDDDGSSICKPWWSGWRPVSCTGGACSSAQNGRVRADALARRGVPAVGREVSGSRSSVLRGPALWAQSPEHDLGLVDGIAVGLGGVEAGRWADRAVHVGDGIAV